ncbi:PA2817 family protein [Marinobacterium litorale]|uniref:PA2817 family protein n=1 Tax=Marinobacterium litorale TaxID=404770 RepID=UPI0003F5E5C1|nr:PA2817 family protein [Marinobacterium litorale]
MLFEDTVTDFHTYHVNLLKLAYNNLIKQEPFSNPAPNPIDREFMEQFAELAEGFEQHQGWAFEEGQAVMTRLVRAYPQLVHLVARDLFWLFGGDCLHHMADEELELFAQLDEARAEAERENRPFDYLAERTRLFNT